MSRILVVDDDIELCHLLSDVLEAEGYLVECVHCGESALKYLEKKAVDLVLLDVMLPKLNGMQVARKICQRFATPILMLTALNDEESILDGYQSGADQYIAKPFKVPELLTRIKAIFRRVGLEKQRQANSCESQGSFDSSQLPLTCTEADLLGYLIKNEGVVVSKAELQIQVLKKELSPYDRNLDMHISNLRRKFVEAGLSKQHIKTVRGKGYSFNANANAG
ncbi:response regulator transcription factor [Vibrio sp. Hep-1b-8]|uniref:response regulator transcription factor n=1 Tax=Vibrio sp. Hep-1b-8 TaxID=2144187 RepID=UPI00110FFB82|nr:response regulator transcription factor [Vibrio sp. Hep-1b-8]TMX45798.1 DNA-binding response regulator [Vibrio sp. Hep-1b-8]